MALSIDRPTTALLVLDMINELVDPAGKFGSQGLAAQIAKHGVVDNIRRALDAARSAGLLVVHIRVQWRPGHPEANTNAPMIAGVKQNEAFVEGTWGTEFYPALQPQPGELAVTKRAISGLTATELPQILVNRGIRTLVLAGVVTNFAIEGTARAAVDSGYGVIVLEDCTTSFTDEMHDFAIKTTLPLLVMISNTNELVAALSGASA